MVTSMHTAKNCSRRGGALLPASASVSPKRCQGNRHSGGCSVPPAMSAHPVLSAETTASNSRVYDARPGTSGASASTLHLLSTLSMCDPRCRCNNWGGMLPTLAICTLSVVRIKRCRSKPIRRTQTHLQMGLLNTCPHLMLCWTKYSQSHKHFVCGQ
jgi:hypothetical protein